MTGRPALTHEDELAAIQERLVRVRRAAVAIRAGALSATGWVALSNGVVVTSRRAIGYPAEISLELEDGLPLAGRVIAADVARDIAVVLPLELPPTVAPLPIRAAPEARLGEAVMVVSSLPGQGLRLTEARVCQLRRAAPPQPLLFEIDAPAPLGAVVLDLEGRVVGVMVAPPRAAVDAALGGTTSALPGVALQGLLTAVDRPALELRERAPIYRCPSCEEPYDVALDRCLACGRALPHVAAPSPSRAAAERHVREALATLGVVANRARTGPRAWRFPLRPFTTAEATHVELTLDEDGGLITLRSPVVSLPAANHEPFYRFLLTMNDQTTGELALSIAGELVSVACADPVEGRSAAELSARIEEMARVADEYRRTLAETFEAAPRHEPGR